MSTLRRKVEDLGEHFYCAIHHQAALICNACDLLDLPAAEKDELIALME
jgi:hypothetical protein